MIIIFFIITMETNYQHICCLPHSSKVGLLCNSAVGDLPGRQLKRLQYVQHVVSRTINKNVLKEVGVYVAYARKSSPAAGQTVDLL